MQRLLLFLFLILIPILSFTQVGKEYKNRRIRSAEQIVSLKDGVIFFRMRTKQVQIDYYRKYNNNKEADKIERKQKELNQSIMDAFKNKFDFCPVYFFYSHDSKHIRLKEFDSVVFLNSKVELDASIKPNPSYYCTAELGNVSSDTAKYYGGTYITETENGLREKERYSSGMNVHFKAIVIKSDQFIQLVPPFPYYSRTYFDNPNPKRLSRCIGFLNSELDRYLRKAEKD